MSFHTFCGLQIARLRHVLCACEQRLRRRELQHDATIRYVPEIPAAVQAQLMSTDPTLMFRPSRNTPEELALLAWLRAE